VAAADVDGDGDLDLLSGSYGAFPVAWYENLTIHRNAAFPAQSVVYIGADNAQSVFAADVDGDGDTDALSASLSDDELAWYENTDGAGSFGAQQVISTRADLAQSVFAADLDGDGDTDALSASATDDEIAWYENTDAAGSYGAQKEISTLADGASSVFASDVDADGDADVLSASANDDEIAWYENGVTFGGQQVISTLANGASSVFAADLDGDGDADALSASGSLADGKIAWYENTDGAGGFGGEQLISTLVVFARSVVAGDVDGDGDLDVLSASQNDDKVAWYEQLNVADPLDPDTDDDGLLDSVETDTGVFVDPSDTGTDPQLADTDGDGFGDGVEVAAGTDPTDPLDFPVPVIPALGHWGTLALALLLAALGWSTTRRRTA
ncbi:MAG: VCBS repeat-containing protein, partial [Actinobacteria bacterium]|nr:VCBS repeat-containing protein [Actinomycetota bacterium]